MSRRKPAWLGTEEQEHSETTEDSGADTKSDRRRSVPRLPFNPFGRNLVHFPPPQDDIQSRSSYVPLGSHDILEMTLDSDPLAIREGLAFALGTDGQTAHWMVTEDLDGNEESLKRHNSDVLDENQRVGNTHSLRPSETNTSDTNPFEYPETLRDLTYDIPMITLDTGATENPFEIGSELESGTLKPPDAPGAEKGGMLAPGSPSKFANIFTRISDRIAGTNNPPTPTVDKTHEHDLINMGQMSKRSSFVGRSPSPSLLASPSPMSEASGSSISDRMSVPSLPIMNQSKAPSAFSRSMESFHSVESVDIQNNISAPTLQISTSSFTPGMAPVMSMASPLFRPADEENRFDLLYLYGKSLMIFGPQSKIRIWCHRVLTHPRANSIILVLIILQTALLCLRQWDPITHAGYYYAGYNWADYLLMAINILYTFELGVKVIAYGLWDDEQMFVLLGLDYPRSGLTYARKYVQEILHANFFWWVPRVRQRFARKTRKLSEPGLSGKYARFMDNEESFHQYTENVENEQHSIRDNTHNIANGNNRSSLNEGPNLQRRHSQTSFADSTPPPRLNNYNTFLHSTNIQKKVEQMNLHRAYLRDNWQRLDFVSIVSFWISLALSISHYDAEHHFMLFRALSCLRILRLCNLTTGTNIILRACQGAIPQLVDISIVIACFWVIFGIIGVQSFKSSLSRHCEWTNPEDASEVFINSDLYCGSYIGLDGIAKPFLDREGNPSGYVKGFRCPQNSVCQSGENPYNGTVNFDNIFQSMQLVFVIMSVNAFSDIMYYLMDTDSLASSLFFVFGMLILTVWLMNIFIAIIVSSFKLILKEDAEETRQRNERRSRPGLLRVWRFNDEMHTKQVLELIERRRWLRYYYRIEYTFVLIITCNMIVQSLRSDDMPLSQAHFLYRCEVAFTVIFAVEIMLRFVLYLPHWRVFFMSKMNWFDLFLAVVTCIIIIDPVKLKLGHAYYWLTVFQIARFYRVVLAHRLTSNLWLKLMHNAEAIRDLALFYFILLFLVSLIGARFFEGQIPIDEIDDVQFAMHTLPNAFMSFYVVTSTENWADIMYELQDFTVSVSQRVFGSIFIILWFIISNFIVMNIFIAVIARALEVTEEGKRKHQLRQFIDDMTHKLQAVSSNPGWMTQIKSKFFGKSDEKNLEKAVTNLLLSGTAVNEFLDNGEELQEPEIQEEPENIKRRSWLKRPWRRIKNFTQNPFYNKKKEISVKEGDFNPALFAKEVLMERRKLIRQQDEYLRENPMFNTVYYMLGPRHKLRRFCQRIVPLSYGERIDGVDPNKTVSDIFALVMFLSTIGIVVTACYLTPLVRRKVIHQYGQYNWTFYVDTSFLLIFALEFVIKTTADGVAFTPNAYLRSPWNWLDFLALLSLWIEFIAFLRNDGNLSRIVRGMKALRALRILTISETAKNNFHYTIISGFGKIISAAFISLTLIFPFSIWGLNIFNGRLAYCVDGESAMEACVNEYASEVFDWEVLSPNVYVNPILEMNRFLSSFSTMYQIVSLEGWTDLLINVMQSTGVGTPQEMFATPINGFFVILFNFASVVFVLTLFVSVIIDNYARVTGRAYLTSPQQQWYHVKRFLMQVKPSKRRRPETLRGIKKFCYNMTVEKNKYWGVILNIVLMLHIIALLVESFPESTAVVDVRYAIFMTSSTCFLLNYLMFSYAQGYKVVIANRWIVFSLLISLGACITTLISYKINTGSMFTNFNKLFLVAMLVFLFPRSDRLLQLLKFASASFPQLISLLFTWFVMFLVYAIAMNQVFGMTKIGPNTSGNINVRSVPKALILLFRCSLGEGWNYIMEDFTLEAPFCESAVLIDDSDCGNKQYAYLLFMSWNVMSMYIMLNLFVSLILDSFSYINGGLKYADLISRAEIRRFKKAWQKFDAEGSGFIDRDDLSKFLHTLDGSLSFHFYAGALSIPELCEKWIIRNSMDDPYDISINYHAMNDMMLVMDIPKIQQRRLQYEQFIEEAIMNMELHGEPGISFRRLLVQIPLYSSFDARQCLTLIDFLERRLFLQKLEKRLKTKRCYELLEGYICRWKYVKARWDERRRSHMSNGSSAVIDPNEDDLFSDGYKLL